ncbi:hypothetical protein RYX36_020332 [Vicia faba]
MTKRYGNITFEEMMEAEIHFGYDIRKWNPRMTPFIPGKCKEMRLCKFRDLRTEQKTEKLNSLPKRYVAMLKRQLFHLETYLGGIKYMTGLHDIVIIVDQQEEYTTLQECITLGIPTICLIDTNCGLDLVDISIPTNDDAIASIR